MKQTTKATLIAMPHVIVTLYASVETTAEVVLESHPFLVNAGYASMAVLAACLAVVWVMFVKASYQEAEAGSV